MPPDKLGPTVCSVRLCLYARAHAHMHASSNETKSRIAKHVNILVHENVLRVCISSHAFQQLLDLP